MKGYVEEKGYKPIKMNPQQYRNLERLHSSKNRKTNQNRLATISISLKTMIVLKSVTKTFTWNKEYKLTEKLHESTKLKIEKHEILLLIKFAKISDENKNKTRYRKMAYQQDPLNLNLINNGKSECYHNIFTHMATHINSCIKKILKT